MEKLSNSSTSPQLVEQDKIFLSFSVMLLLSFHFTLQSLAHTYSPGNLLDPENPSFWVYIFNAAITAAIVYYTKKFIGWTWNDLGLTRSQTWWKFLLVSAAIFLTVVLFAHFIVPVFVAFSGPTETDYFFPLRQNLPKLLSMLITSWITGAFLQEVVFRAFLINALDIFMGKNRWSIWASVVVSSLIFGLIHAYQGFTGVLVTGSIGLIFGTAYVLNGRKLWSLILVHALVDTIFLLNMYNS